MYMAGPGIEPRTPATMVRSSITELPRPISTVNLAPTTTLAIVILKCIILIGSTFMEKKMLKLLISYFRFESTVLFIQLDKLSR